MAQRRKRIRDVGRCADVVARERDETEQISGTPRRAIFFFFFLCAATSERREMFGKKVRDARREGRRGATRRDAYFDSTRVLVLVRDVSFRFD